MIKYGYALDSNDKLIDIEELERHNHKKSDKYFSVDFRQELIPKLGKIKVKHFALKPNCEMLGTKETYLHALGKRVFKEEYLDSLAKKEPFYITYKTSHTCIWLKEKYDITCNFPDSESPFDLTTYFTQIHEETKDDNFRPDLMLSNLDTQEKIYIEIAVTHFSSVEKLEKGTRIIEIKLNSDRDIRTIKELKIGHSPTNIFYYNFKKKHQKAESCNNDKCNCNFDIFLVKENGKCELHTYLQGPTLKVIVANAVRNGDWYSIYPLKEGSNNYLREFDVFKEYVLSAKKQTDKAKNCYICRHHSEKRIKCEPGKVYCMMYGTETSYYNELSCGNFELEKPS